MLVVPPTANHFLGSAYARTRVRVRAPVKSNKREEVGKAYEVEEHPLPAKK